MRQLVEYEPVKVKTFYRTQEMSDDEFGPFWEDMLHFVSIKHRISVDSARQVAKTIFRYIHGEVFLNGERMTIPGFGTFNRGPPLPPSQDGFAPAERAGYPITVSRRSMTARFENEEDPENAGPREVDDE